MRLRLIPAIVVLFAIAFGYLIHAWRTPESPPSNTQRIEKPNRSVVTAIRGLARLEGAEFHMERIVDLREKQDRLYGLLKAEDAILLVAAGNVIAGIDLTKMMPEDITTSTDGKSAKVVLPAAEIFTSALDNSRTYVHSRKTDVLAQRKNDLESSARARAEVSLREGAIEAHILRHAETNVQRTVTQLLLSLGFEQVDVSLRPTPKE